MVLAGTNHWHLSCALPWTGMFLPVSFHDLRWEVGDESGVHGGLGFCPGSHTSERVAETFSKVTRFPESELWTARLPGG